MLKRLDTDGIIAGSAVGEGEAAGSSARSECHRSRSHEAEGQSRSTCHPSAPGKDERGTGAEGGV